MNLIQKMHALMVSDKVNIWHYPMKKDGPSFVYWLVNEPGNEEGYTYWTLDAMIESAYKRIDPLEHELPKELQIPEHFLKQYPKYAE